MKERTQSIEDKKKVEEFLKKAVEKRSKNQALTETEETYLQIYEKTNHQEIMWRDIEFYVNMAE